MNGRQETSTRFRRPAVICMAAATVIGLGGCDSLLDVEVPGAVTADDLFQPASAPILVSSLVADFECSFSMMSAAMSGGEDATWKTSGWWGDTTEHQTIRPGGGSCTANSDVTTSWFQGFQKSRFLAETAHGYLSEWTDAEVANRQQLLAVAAAYAGMYYTLMGERYCEFVRDSGPALTPSDMLREAEVWFTQSVDHGDHSYVTTPSTRQLALLGRARVRLALNDLTGAAADAAEIQPGFQAVVTRDGSVRPRWNAVYQAFNVTLFRTVAGPVWWLGHEPDQLVSVGYYDLTIADDGRQTVGDGMPDPRVPVEFSGQFAQDGVTDQYNQLKYTDLGAPQAIAKWAEAQLILAEIEGGQGAVARINALRDVHGLPHFSSNDEEEIFSAIVEERRREFFFEGRHWADKLRYGLWFPRGQGWNHKLVRYGFGYCLLPPEGAYELNPDIPTGYEGPDTSDPNYVFELQIDQPLELGTNWPVPLTLN